MSAAPTRPLIRALVAACIALASAFPGFAWSADPAPRVLRYALPVAETGFDPAQVVDLYSTTLISHLFDSPLQYDALARPARLVPGTAAAMPEVSADGRTIRVRLRPGIRFIDDPAFGGRPRELVAEDYVYSIKRHFDPRWRSPTLSVYEDHLVGLRELRDEALRTGRFDYDRPVPGLRAVDRYTFEMRLHRRNAGVLYALAECRASCAVAREVVEAHGERVMEHPVGTGPFRLVSWKRSSRMVFERHPGYREERFAGNPAPDDPRGLAIARALAGRRLPMLDRVEVDVVEEAQPRWLAFLNGQHDLIESLPNEFAPSALPGDTLSPELAQRGVRREKVVRLDVRYTYFNWIDPVVGGPKPEQVALRRAISLAYRSDDDLRILRRGQALPAHGVVPPGALGHDPALRSEMNTHDPVRARALLDTYGYRDRDGDGYRELPDGRALALVFGTGNDQAAKQHNELWQRSLKDVGLRVAFRRSPWPEQLKAARAGRLQLWSVGQSMTSPDAESLLAALYGPNAGRQNLSRFSLPAFDRLYEAMIEAGEPAERQRHIGEMTRLVLAYQPWKCHVHSVANDLTAPSVVGWRPHPVMRRHWDRVDVSDERATDRPRPR